jgi:ADP-ribosylglycohydrolase
VNARVAASLQGIAVGDAIGKQTEMLTRADVMRCYPDGVRGFEGPPGAIIPRYVGNRKREWLIGETTDDTECTIAVARAILHDGDVKHASVGRELLPCRKSVHPGVASLWEFHEANDPARVADRHDGCGAAVRVAPVGMLFCSRRLDAIVGGAHEASVPTHGGPLALAAAAATAAAVSSAIDGAEPHDIMKLALCAASMSERQRSGKSVFVQSMQTTHHDLAHRRELTPDNLAATYFPNTPLTIVPLAISLATVMESAEDAILLAANIGGDSDSVASIAGAILGARRPETVNSEWSRIVEQVNVHDLASIAAGLSALRG